MIHPLEWSLKSVYHSLMKKWNGIPSDCLSYQDIKAYNLLNVKDRIVLDIGAYTGDSAKLFLKKGAKKILAIEVNTEYAKQIDMPNIIIYNEPFNLKHLALEFDCMKVDIEGYEALLLEYDKPFKPCVMEVHSSYLVEKFLERGFKIISKDYTRFENIISQTMMINFEP